MPARQFDSLLAQLDGPLLKLQSSAENEISELKALHSKIEIFKKRFEGLIEASAQLIWVTDAKGLVCEDSPSWNAFTGQTFAEFSGEGWLNAVHPEDRTIAFKLWQECIEKNQKYETTYRLRHHTGDWRWTRARAVSLGNGSGWIGLNEDIHAHALAEIALADNEYKFRTLAETGPAFFWIADKNARVCYWNPAWYEYTGLSQEHSCGFGAANAIAPEAKNLIMQKWKKAMKGGCDFEAEVPLVSKTGECRWFLSKARPIRNEKKQIIRWHGAMLDINEQKKLVEDLRAERNLREKFVATLTHDLRNAITSGKTSIQTLVKYPERVATLSTRHFKIISRCFTRIESMIGDLLDANRIHAGEAFPLKARTVFSLRDLAADVCESLNNTNPGRFFHQGVTPVEGYWSREDLLRVLENLALNALKYGATDTPITLITDETENKGILKIHNFGKPIHPDRVPFLFEFFKRDSEGCASEKQGWGIGLTLVKGIVDALGGSVQVESDQTHGTFFIVEIPKG